MPHKNTAIWELDFYSRPVLDENGKRIWELLICNPERSFTWASICPGSEVGAEWLSQELARAMEKSGLVPLKVRFYRNSMSSIIVRGCKEAGIVPQASRRLFALSAWLQERMATVYPQEESFQGPDPQPLPLQAPGQIVPQALPDALRADQWQIISLAVEELADAAEWPIDFGEFFPVTLPPDQEIPGVLMRSERAMALAAWMSGLDPVFLKFWERIDRVQLRLDAAADASWVVANLIGEEGKVSGLFEAAKQACGGIHFLAVQQNPDTDRFAGFWLLKEV